MSRGLADAKRHNQLGELIRGFNYCLVCMAALPDCGVMK